MGDKMSVQIVKADAVCWYAGRIGDRFEVDAGLGGYYFREGDNGYVIRREDAVDVDGLENDKPKSDRDLIIELSRTVARLERKIEMLTDDIVMLDERTQGLTRGGAIIGE